MVWPFRMPHDSKDWQVRVVSTLHNIIIGYCENFKGRGNLIPYNSLVVVRIYVYCWAYELLHLGGKYSHRMRICDMWLGLPVVATSCIAGDGRL